MRAKRTVSGLIALAIAGIASSAQAGQTGQATLTIGSVGATPGETVRVPVSLSTDDLVGAIDVVTDAAGLVVADVDYNGPLFSSGWQGWDTTPSVAASVSAACIFPEDQVTGHDIPLLDLLIHVPADAPPQSQYIVTMSSALVSDYSFDPYDVTIVAGAILVVTEGCAEDVDGNGVVGFGDVLDVLSSWGTCVCPADVNADGTVGLQDLLLVLANWGTCE